MKLKILFLAECLFISNITPAFSHHVRSQFQYNTTITLNDKVVDFKWRNPHSSAKPGVINENNGAEAWLIAGDATASISKTGLD